MYRLYVTEYWKIGVNSYEYNYDSREEAHAYIERHIFDSFYPAFTYVICNVTDGKYECIEMGGKDRDGRKLLCA